MIGTYTLTVSLSNSYTEFYPSVSKEISGSPIDIIVLAPNPIWSTDALSQSAFFIYAAAAVSITLPSQIETGFNTATFTHTIHVISTPSYTGNTACNTNADDTCFNSATEANNLSVFSADLTDL